MVWIEITIAIAILIHLAFLIGFLKKDNSIMTFVWPIGIIVVYLVSYNFYNIQLRSLRIVLILLLVWGLRLFLYGLIRNIQRGYEDFRYKDLRDKNTSDFILISYIQFYVFQGLFMIIIGSIFVFAHENPSDVSNLQLYLGIGFFSIGFIIETVADYQLYTFKKESQKDEILMTGIWKLSRHPNYLGEILIWWSFAMMVFTIENWLVIISPLVLTLLLRYVSGVPLIDKRYKGNELYQTYKSKTPTLFPFF